ncbi:MAG: hypothetical protein JWO38_1968 [Gemmataceae bacterium]|nr:hypothetical protein [Gemmataceae bacterium]
MSTAPTAPPAYPGHPDWAGPQRFALGAAVVGIALFAVAGGINLAAAKGEHAEGAAKTHFLSAYLAGWTFWMSLPVGGMALLMIHYLAKTSWGLLLKRSLESATRTLPLMAALFVPFAALAMTLGEHSPYWWVAPEHTEIPGPPPTAEPRPGEAMDAQTAQLAAKYAERRKASVEMVKKAVEIERKEHAEGNLNFLSPPMFVLLSVVYFAIWGTMIYFLNKWGQDAETDPAKVESSLEKLKNLSGPGLIVYAITLTAASTQWVMSLQEGWASTMFPVIFAVNQFLTCFAFSVAGFLLLVGRPPFKDVMRPKFQLDMGSLMLAFTLFWSYTSFSQMMLIWIGNLPEEIPFYLKRSNNTGWWWVSAGLIVFHFGLPFILLLFRDIKLHPVRLRVMAIYLLVVCAIDVVWWVEPTFEHESPLFILMDVGAVAGIGGLWGWFFLNHLKKRPLLPTNETYMLPEGHHHEHH